MSQPMIPHRININPALESEINSYLFSAEGKGYDDLNLYEWASVMLWKKLYDKELPKPIPNSTVLKTTEILEEQKKAMRKFKITVGLFSIALIAVLLLSFFFPK